MSNQIEKCSIMFVLRHHTTNGFLSTNSVEQWLMVYVMWKLHAIFIKWYMVISEHKLIGFISTELQNDDNDDSLPFRLIWCVFICVINESNRSCSMNPLQIRRIDDLSVRAQSPFLKCALSFLHRRQDWVHFGLLDVSIQNYEVHAFSSVLSLPEMLIRCS